MQVLSEKKIERSGEIFAVGDIFKIDVSKYKAYVEGREVPLTSTEFKIAAILMENQDWVLSRWQILDKLWGHDKFVIDRTIGLERFFGAGRA